MLASIDSASLYANTQTSTWLGPGGSDWNTATNWSPTGVPNNGTNGFTDYNVIIGTPSPALLDISPTIDSLTVNSSSQLTINPGLILTISGPTVTNNGLIQVDNLGNNAAFNFSGNTLLTGSGAVLLDDYSPNARLNANAGVVLTQDVNSTISGVGEIDAALVNNGTVNANFSGHTLFLQTYNMSNNGLFEATNSATLSIAGINVTQGVNAQILSTAGTAVSMTNVNVSGGRISSVGNGVVNVNNVAFNNVNITSGSTVVIYQASTLNITGGSLINNGYIQVDTNSQNANLNFNSSTNVTGTGNIFLYDNNPHPTINASTGAVVTFSAGQTISGEGTINAGLVSNGIINANFSNQSLLLQTNAMTNNNIFEATGGGSLNINGIVVTQATGASITAYNGSGVSIFGGANISGGTLTSTATGIINVSTATFNNVNISTGTQVVVAPATTLNITGGSLINNGLIQVDINSQNANLNFIGNTSVTGTGTIFLYDNNPLPTLNSSAGSTVTLGSGQTVVGDGAINAVLVNNGIINANISNQALTLQTSAMTNNKLFEATAGATLKINGILVTQATGATISASNISAISLYGGANISGGTLAAATGGVIYVSNATFNNINISTGTQVTVQAGAPLYITGTTLNNNGLIQVDTFNSNASINFNNSTAITGTGSIFLDDYSPNAKLASAAGVTITQSAANTIYGVGEIDAALINNGTVNSTFNGHTLFLQNGLMTNNGLFEATNGATLNINGIAVTQSTAGLIKTDATSAISINNSNISGGTISSSGSGAINVATANFASVNLSTGTQINVSPSTTLAITGSISTGNGIGLTIGTSATTTFGPAANVSNRALILLSSLSDSGRLDLGNNDMDVIGGSLSTITSLVSAGANLTVGIFNGPTGITSVSAAANTAHLFALGTIQNNQSGTALFSSSKKFDGYTPGAADILIKYTYFGDANLDGKVDGSDYSRIDSSFLSEKTGPAVTGWFNGDFNYDGVVNGSDYTLIDNAYNTQGAQVTSELATATAQVAGTSAVPEPAFIGAFVVVSGALGRRRRSIVR